ncbi:hypothetical protein [Kitasatospora sp. NPDC001132]
MYLLLFSEICPGPYAELTDSSSSTSSSNSGPRDMPRPEGGSLHTSGRTGYRP